MGNDSASKLYLIQACVESTPEGWSLLKVGKSLVIRNNFRKPINQEVRSTIQGAYPYYGPTKIQDYISEYEQDGTYALIGEDGDHFLKYSTMSQTQYISGKCTVNNHAHILESTKICDAEWFYTYFKNRDITNFLSRQGSGRFKLNKATLEKLPMLVPPLPEQRKIAQILSAWDKAISVTESLIENSKQQKKALMQQLLTGKKRFEGFEQKWEEVSFGELGSTFNGLTGKNKDDFGKGKPYIPYINIFKNSSINIQALELVNVSDDEKQNCVEYGDIFFTTSSETPQEVGMASVLLSKNINNVYLNSFCFGFRLNSFDKLLPEFAQFLFRGEVARRKISTLAQGATRYNLSKKQLLKLHIQLPSVKEQQKIASVLAAADQKIDTLEQKLTHLKQEKKALTQQLLTGTRRVKTEKEF